MKVMFFVNETEMFSSEDLKASRTVRLGMSKSPILGVVSLIALLAACASPNHAAHGTGEGGETCTYRPGGSGLLGLAAALGAFDREVPCSALGRAPVVVEGQAPPVPVQDFSNDGMSAAEGPMGSGQTVYSPSECIGAVVMGVCHGSILPDYSRPHSTCYGQMLNGVCTGPMF
jgi:hypothetical protein